MAGGILHRIEHTVINRAPAQCAISCCTVWIPSSWQPRNRGTLSACLTLRKCGYVCHLQDSLLPDANPQPDGLDAELGRLGPNVVSDVSPPFSVSNTAALAVPPSDALFGNPIHI